MQKSFFPVAVVFSASLLFTSCSGSKHAQSTKLAGTWQATPIVIDGDSKDWPSPYPEYDSKAALGYAVSNDADNLYITVETGDEAEQMKILRQGLTVWIDSAGGKERTTSINFPVHTTNRAGNINDEEGVGSRPSGMRAQGGQGRPALSERVKVALKSATSFSLEGFKGCNGDFALMQTDTCGIKVSIAIDEYNELIWEAVVPFKAFYHKAHVDMKDKGKPLSVCFETNGFKRPAPKDNGKGGGGGMSGGGGGMGMHGGGGGMHGGHGGGRANQGQANGSEVNQLYNSSKTWKTFGIAFQN